MKALALLWVFQLAIVFRLTSSEVIHIVANKSLDRTPNFGYVNFIFHPNSSLEVENTLQVHAKNYKQCLVVCASDMTCVSINFGKQPIFFHQGENRYLCELLPADKYKSSSMYQSDNPRFDHYSIKSICSKSPCLYNFTCIPNYPEDSYECLCPRPPYEGKDCKDADECSSGLHDCSPNATCTNIIGSYKCACKAGYFGNGTTCIKIPIIQESWILRDYGNASYHTAVKSFMDQVPEDITNIEWIRCWSGMNDGFVVRDTFHPHCDGKGPTVTIVRKGVYIWGGYTDVSWLSKDPWERHASTKSFIFSLYNVDGFSPVKFDILSSGYNVAVTHSANFGPYFGLDLVILNSASTYANNNNKPYAYVIPPGCGRFRYCSFFTNVTDSSYTIDDIEVFYKNTA